MLQDLNVLLAVRRLQTEERICSEASWVLMTHTPRSLSSRHFPATLPQACSTAWDCCDTSAGPRMSPSFFSYNWPPSTNPAFPGLSVVPTYCWSTLKQINTWQGREFLLLLELSNGWYVHNKTMLFHVCLYALTYLSISNQALLKWGRYIKVKDDLYQTALSITQYVFSYLCITETTLSSCLWFLILSVAVYNFSYSCYFSL